MKNGHRSKFSNLSNWKEEAWKNQGFNGIRTRDLRDTGAMLYQMSYEATHWEWGHSSLWSTTAVHILIISYILNAISLLIFFRLVLSNCLKWKIYCDDHSSLWSTTAVHIWIMNNNNIWITYENKNCHWKQCFWYGKLGNIGKNARAMNVSRKMSALFLDVYWNWPAWVQSQAAG